MKYSDFFYNNDFRGYLSPNFCNDQFALEFDHYLADNVTEPLDKFGSNYPWDAPVPPREEWDNAVQIIDESMEDEYGFDPSDPEESNS